MTDLDRQSRPIRIVARKRQLPLGLAETARHPRESPPAPLTGPAPTDRLHPGCPYYCSWDLESCLRYWM